MLKDNIKKVKSDSLMEDRGTVKWSVEEQFTLESEDGKPPGDKVKKKKKKNMNEVVVEVGVVMMRMEVM
jgi:hypothetical protein